MHHDTKGVGGSSFDLGNLGGEGLQLFERKIIVSTGTVGREGPKVVGSEEGEDYKKEGKREKETKATIMKGGNACGIKGKLGKLQRLVIRWKDNQGREKNGEWEPEVVTIISIGFKSKVTFDRDLDIRGKK